MDDRSAPVRNPLRRLYLWVLSWADRKSGTWALFFFSMAEASFFPIPPDVLMMALILGKRAKAWRFAAVTLAGSLIGAIVGYLIGWGFWASTKNLWLGTFFSEDAFDRVSQLYQKYDALAVFAAAFSPIPFKVFTIAAGVFGLNLFSFLGASFIGRGARFYLVAGIFYWLGPRARPFIDRWFNWLALLFVVLLVLGFWVIPKLL